MTTSQENTTERQYFRTSVRLTVRYGEDTDSARQAMAMDREMWSMQSRLEESARGVLEKQSLPESMLPLMDVIRWMDFKLDMVLYHLRMREHDLHFPHQLDIMDISGSGLGVAGVQALETGRRILLAVNLPNSPWRPLYAVGEVVRRDKREEADSDLVGINFVEIADADRERIIRFTFEQQRRQLARRSQEMEP